MRFRHLLDKVSNFSPDYQNNTIFNNFYNLTLSQKKPTKITLFDIRLSENNVYGFDERALN